MKVRTSIYDIKRTVEIDGSFLYNETIMSKIIRRIRSNLRPININKLKVKSEDEKRRYN